MAPLNSVTETPESWNASSEALLTERFPLHKACRDGDLASVCQILSTSSVTHLNGEINRAVFVEDPFYGWTPAHWASYFGKLDCLQKIVQVSRHVDAPTSRFLQTACHMAAYANQPHCLKWLLQSGAHPNRQDYMGESALHKAARTGSLDCITLLLCADARVNLMNAAGQTPGAVAAMTGNGQAAHIIEQHSQNSPFSAVNFSSFNHSTARPRSPLPPHLPLGDILMDPSLIRNERPLAGRKRNRHDQWMEDHATGGMDADSDEECKRRRLLEQDEPAALLTPREAVDYVALYNFQCQLALEHGTRQGTPFKPIIQVIRLHASTGSVLF